MTDNTPNYAVVEQGDKWAVIRDGTVIHTWDRDQDPTIPRIGILAQVTPTVEARLGHRVTWVQHDGGYRPVPA